MTDINEPKPVLSDNAKRLLNPPEFQNKVSDFINSDQFISYKYQPVYSPPDPPKIEFRTPEVKVIPEPKTKLETFVSKHNGLFTLHKIIL